MGKGHSLGGGCVVTPLNVKAWGSSPMSTEHSGPQIPLRRRPCAVKVACTVTTGGMERRVKDTAFCPYPLTATDGLHPLTCKGRRLLVQSHCGQRREGG